MPSVVRVIEGEMAVARAESAVRGPAVAVAMVDMVAAAAAVAAAD